MVGDRRDAVGGNVLLPANLVVQSESSICLTKSTGRCGELDVFT